MKRHATLASLSLSGSGPRRFAAAASLAFLLVAAAGVAIAVVAQLARGLLRAVLFRTETTDLAAIAVTAAILLSAAALACLAPALRAARVAPVEGLRSE